MATINLERTPESRHLGHMPSVVTGSKKLVQHLIDHMRPDQIAEVEELRLRYIDTRFPRRKVHGRRNSEALRQTSLEKSDLRQVIRVRVEVTTSAITTTATIVHVPNSESKRSSR
jgi:hypothetical protein